ncbi:uncharacterized protein Bdp1 [Drosophila tropicalis]|uniref:uncharacterized protein Bdp1 n=1 Tax=Drosophila tropicalis TaxID=46794 RepID=UPI0035AC1C54
MAMRRQRIKAMANLANIKRKPRKDETPVQKEEREPEVKGIDEQIPFFQPEALESAEPDLGTVETPAELEAEPYIADAKAFKMPASSVGQMDDIFHSDIEDNVIQMDLQKTTTGYPMSPGKAQARQRVRPTPVFGQRRNSFVGSPMASDYDSDYQSPATPTRRERYLSGSSSMGQTPSAVAGAGSSPMPQSPYKYFPPVMSPGMGRIRTESTCSVYSEGGSKQRKTASDDKCQPGQRVNARRDFETRFNKGIPDKSTFKMFDMIFYNPENNPMEQKPLVTTIKAESNGDNGDSAAEAKPNADHLLEAKQEATTTAMPVPQLKLDANGEMIIDEKTLEIETTAEVEARKVLANSSLILMDETTGDNGFYKRHKRTPYWTSDETVRFYRSLQIIGTDFSLMCQMFPQRTRRDLKLKYKKEERINAQLINKALLYPKAFNIQELKEQLEQEDRDRKEKDRQWQEIIATQAENTKKRAKPQQSKAARSLSDGDVIYENENVTKKKLAKHIWAKRCKALETDENIKEMANKPPRKRRRQQPPVQVDSGVAVIQPESNILPSFNTIKQETIIKTEHSLAMAKGQIQQELNDLLAEDQEMDSLESERLDFQSVHNKTIMDLDDGSLNYVRDMESILPTQSSPIDLVAPPDSFNVSAATETVKTASVSEEDIEQILSDLAEGSLVLVSSVDAENGDRVINEIYMYDKSTGELFEEPLNIPEHIVQCILNVMS